MMVVAAVAVRLGHRSAISTGGTDGVGVGEIRWRRGWSLVGVRARLRGADCTARH